MSRSVAPVAPAAGAPVRPVGARRAALRRRLPALAPWGGAVAAVGLSLAVSTALESWLPLSVAALLLIFLSGVLVVAVRTARGPALLAAALSFVAYNFFFTAPRYTLEIHQTADIITVVLFALIALVGSNLAGRLRLQLAHLAAINAHNGVLLALDQALAGADTVAAQCAAAVRVLAAAERCPVCIVESAAGPDGVPAVAVLACSDPARMNSAAASAALAGGDADADGAGGTGAGRDGWQFVRLPADDAGAPAALGVQAVPDPTERADPADPQARWLADRPDGERLRQLGACAQRIAAALARTRLEATLAEARMAEETERLRAALLASVSHDLRTPLAAVIGAAGTLRDCADRLGADDRAELVDSVLGEALRLDRYIENLLDMTRLGHGVADLRRDWAAVPDLVAASVRRVRVRDAGLQVRHDLPDDLPLLYVHGALVEQALVNVLENAARFTPADTPVTVRAHVAEGRVLIDITDRGPGIAAADRERVFEMFWRGQGTGECDGGTGSGLGLAICRGMIGAHMGSVVALPGPDGRGTTIRIALPIQPGGAPAAPGGSA